MSKRTNHRVDCCCIDCHNYRMNPTTPPNIDEIVLQGKPTTPDGETPRTDVFGHGLGKALANNRRDIVVQMNEINELIESQIAPMECELAQLELLVKELETTQEFLERDNERLEKEKRELENQLRLIGDMAVIDWDDVTVGKVDAVIKGQPPQTYIDKVRNLCKRAQEAEPLEEKNKALLAAGNELANTLQEDALWCFNNTIPPTELKASWSNGWGDLTSGPNNCKKFYNLKKQALTNWQNLTKKPA